MSDQSTLSQPPQTAQRRHVFWQQVGPGDNFNANNKFAIRLAPPQQRWSLRFNPEADNAPSFIAGFDVSQPINIAQTASAKDGTERLSCRVGPDEWLLIADTATATPTLEQALVRDLALISHTLVDVSHRNVGLEITGAYAADVLNTGCPLDLGDQAFPVGTATRTLFSKAEIVLIRYINVAGATTYRVECWRSFARYLSAHLTDSARLLGLDED